MRTFAYEFNKGERETELQGYISQLITAPIKVLPSAISVRVYIASNT